MSNSNDLRAKLPIFLLVLFVLACDAISSAPFPSPTITNLPVTSTGIPTASATPTISSPASEGWIAFVNQNNLWLIHPDGNGLKQVTNNPSSNNNYDIKIGWSPDGRKLGFSQGSRLYVLDLATFNTTLLVDDTAGGFDWSLTGKQIIYDTLTLKSNNWSDHGLWVINLENGKNRQFVAPSDNFSGYSKPQWSSEGSHVLFTIPAWEPAGYGVVDLTTGNSVRLPLNVKGGAGWGGCEWAPSELIIACTTLTDEFPYKPEFRLIDANGTIRKKITLPDHMSNCETHWSPDGNKLAISCMTNEFPMGILSLDTDNFQILTQGIVSDWSPDGHWILALQKGPDQGEIYMPFTISEININTGQSFPIAEGASPIWQPSPKSLANPQLQLTQSPEAISTESVSTPAENTPSSSAAFCTDTGITLRHSAQGNYLQLCADNKPYEVGPLENGGYAMGPNGKFFVYATNSGPVYGARVGDTILTLIGSVKDFSIIRRGEAPQYEFQFFGDNPYTIQIRELILKQDETLSIPFKLTKDN